LHIPPVKQKAVTLECLPSHSGFRLLAGGGDGTATIMSGPSAPDMRIEKQIQLDGRLASLSLNQDASEALAVSSGGSSFQIRCQDLSVRVHNQVSPGALYDVSYPSQISDLFLTCCGDGLVTMWDANDYSARLRCPVRAGAYPLSVAASEDILIAGCSDGRLLCFDCDRGSNLWHVDNAHKGGATTLRLASNMRFVISGGAEGELRVWELQTKNMKSNLKEHAARVNEVKLFPNDCFAISASRDRCLLTWDLTTEKRLTHHRDQHGGLNCLALASNQTTVMTAGQDKTLTTWDLRMADPVHNMELDEVVNTISISPDDRYLATAGTGLVVKIWDLQTNATQSVGVGHSRAVQKLSFSPDGKQVVSVGLDHSILVWNFYT